MAGALAAPFFPAPSTSQAVTQEVLSCSANLARLFPASLDSARTRGMVCRSCDLAEGTPSELIDALCPDPASRALLASGPDDAIASVFPCGGAGSPTYTWRWPSGSPITSRRR